MNKHLTLITYLLFAIIFSERALANKKCDDITNRLLPSVSIDPVITKIIKLDDVSDDVVQKISDIITSVNQRVLQYSTRYKTPSSLKLYIREKEKRPNYGGASFYGITTTHQLFKPLPPHNKAKSSLKNYSKHPIFSEPITAHEYGHTILRATMRKLNSKYDEMLKIKEPYDNIMRVVKAVKEKTEEVEIKLKHYLNKQGEDVNYFSDWFYDNYGNYIDFEYSDEFEQFKSSEQFVKLWNQWKKLEATSLKAEEKRSPHLSNMYQAEAFTIHTVFSPLTELFADTIAVLNNNNMPKTVSDSIFITRNRVDQISKGKVDKSIYRDFSRSRNRIDRWDPTFQRHGMMAPARFFLYEKAIKMPMYNSDKGRGIIIDNLLAAIEKELKFLINNLEQVEEEMTPTERNLRLINLLEIEFSKNHL